MESLGGFSGGFCFKSCIHPDGKENTQKHSGGHGSRVSSVKFSLALLMKNAFNKTALMARLNKINTVVKKLGGILMGWEIPELLCYRGFRW